jgi:hypothetical protein
MGAAADVLGACTAAAGALRLGISTMTAASDDAMSRRGLASAAAAARVWKPSNAALPGLSDVVHGADSPRLLIFCEAPDAATG